ncbi:hypothetical protein Q9L58_008920 [Maublancomyces gigas]|uniref:Uncharacterized protein n=1 Tax=Discina gigas TaxID=1032678 RepID=A0ABR3G8F8_9PEZI
MSHTLSQLTQLHTDAYLATLGAFTMTLEDLLSSMLSLMHSDEDSFGLVERELLLSNLESAKDATASIALFRQANRSLGTLTPAQRGSLDGLMRTVQALEDDMVELVEELEIIKCAW